MVLSSIDIAARAAAIAIENYGTWGSWVVECMTMQEIGEAVEEAGGLEQWVQLQINVQQVRDEITNTRW